MIAVVSGRIYRFPILHCSLASSGSLRNDNWHKLIKNCLLLVYGEYNTYGFLIEFIVDTTIDSHYEVWSIVVLTLNEFQNPILAQFIKIWFYYHTFINAWIKQQWKVINIMLRIEKFCPHKVKRPFWTLYMWRFTDWQISLCIYIFVYRLRTFHS